MSTMTPFTTAPQTTTVGPHLADLRQRFVGKRPSLEWLVIAHNAPAMVRRVMEVVNRNSAAVLQAPQSAWDFDADSLSQAIAWSVSNANLQHLLVVGHSQAMPHDERASPAGDGLGVLPLPGCKQSSGDRLLDRVERVQAQIQRSKDHYAQQISRLCGLREVREGLTQGRLQLHCLFYIAESGSFLLFDFVNQTFDPLTD